MYANGQTLKHKKTNKLARLDPTPGESWAWDIDEKTAFIAENGTKFVDDIKNYTHIEDELGRPYARTPKEGQFVDESAKKYLVSKEKLAKMRQARLEEWERLLLGRMSGDIMSLDVFEVNKDGTSRRRSLDTPGKNVLCPFADGGESSVFRDFFLKRRGAVPLYKVWSKYVDFPKGGFMDGPMVFRHTDGKVWLYNSPHMRNLVVLEDESIVKELELVVAK